MPCVRNPRYYADYWLRPEEAWFRGRLGATSTAGMRKTIEGGEFARVWTSGFVLFLWAMPAMNDHNLFPDAVLKMLSFVLR